MAIRKLTLVKDHRDLLGIKKNAKYEIDDAYEANLFKKDGDVYRYAGVLDVIKNTKDDAKRRAMILFASCRIRGIEAEPRADDSECVDVVSTVIHEMNEMARKVTDKRNPMSEKDFRAIVLAVASQNDSGVEARLRKLSKAVKKHEGFVRSFELPLAKVDSTRDEGILALMKGLKHVSLGDTQLSQKRLDHILSILTRAIPEGAEVPESTELDEDKGAALASVIRDYHERGERGMTEGTPSLIEKLLGKNTEQLKAMHTVFSRLPEGKDRFYDTLLSNMRFEECKETILTYADSLSQTIDGAAETKANALAKVIEKLKKVPVKLARGSVTLEAADLERIIERGPEKMNVLLEALEKGDVLQPRNVSRILDMFKEGAERVTTDRCNALAGCIERLSEAGVPLSTQESVKSIAKRAVRIETNNLKELIAMDGTQIQETQKLLAAVGDSLDSEVTAQIMRFVSGNIAAPAAGHGEEAAAGHGEEAAAGHGEEAAAGHGEEVDAVHGEEAAAGDDEEDEAIVVAAPPPAGPRPAKVADLVACIRLLKDPKYNLPLHRMDTAKSAVTVKPQRHLERLLALEERQAEVVRLILEAMGTGEELGTKLSNDRVNMLLDVVEDAGAAGMPDVAQLTAICNIIRNCDLEEAPLTKHSLLKSLIHPNTRDQVIRLYQAIPAKMERGTLESIGELVAEIGKETDDALKTAKFNVLEAAIRSGFSDDARATKRAVAFFKSEPRLRDIVGLVNGDNNAAVLAIAGSPERRTSMDSFRKAVNAYNAPVVVPVAPGGGA